MLKINRLRKQKGLTLVELMISLALSATLMVGVSQVFVGMRQTERSQESYSRMQEAGRFAINFLAQDIRMANYLGCASTIEDVISTLDSAPASFQPGQGIQGWEAASTSPGNINVSVNNASITSISGSGGTNWLTSEGNSLDATNVVNKTDVIKIWSASGAGTNAEIVGRVTALPIGISPVIKASSNLNIKDGDILMLSDCDQAAMVQACDASIAGGTLNLTLSGSCSPGNINSIEGYGVIVVPTTVAVKLASTTFYIGKRGNNTANPPALFRQTLLANGTSGQPEELVEGIADMQIIYGEKTNLDNKNVADYYVPANLVSDWNNVVSVRISILVQSIADNIAPQPTAYFFNGVNYDGTAASMPTDRRLRRVFTTTIGIRNRSLGV